MALATEVAATSVEKVVKRSVERIISAAADLGIYKITRSPLDEDTGVHVHLTGNFNTRGLLELQALLHGSEIDRLVFRALCTSHLLGILRLEEQHPGIRSLFRCRNVIRWNTEMHYLRVLAVSGKNNMQRAASLLHNGDVRSIIFTFATPSENGMSLVIPRTISFCEWVRDMKAAFAMGLCCKESLVWMLDSCLVDTILQKAFPVEEVDESDVLAILEKLDLNVS